MAQLLLNNTIPPQPSTKRNYTTHLSFNKSLNALAYPCGNSAFVRFLHEDKVIQFKGHANSPVTVAKFANNGSTYVASGDESGKVFVWSWNNDMELSIKSEFRIIAGPIMDISWDNDNQRLCIVGSGQQSMGAFVSWDSGNSIGEVVGHSRTINSCAIRPKRPLRAVTVGDDSAVGFYNGVPFKFNSSDKSSHSQGKFIRCVRFQPNLGNFFITVGSDRKICCFDGTTGAFIKSFEDTERPIESGLFAIDWLNEDKFITSSADGIVRAWNLESGNCFHRWDLHSDINSVDSQQVGCVAINENECLSLSLNGDLNILNLDQDKPIRVIHGHNKSITSLVVNPLITGSYDGKVVDWESNTLYTNHKNLISSISNLQYPRIHSLSWDDTLQENGKILIKFDSQPEISEAFQEFIIAVNSNNEVLQINGSTGDIINQIKLTKPASAITMSNNYIAVGYSDTYDIEIIKTSDLSHRTILATPMRATPTKISISPRETYIAVGDNMGKIVLYEMETKSVKTTRWSFHSGKITSMTWQPVSSDGDEDDDEDLCATGSLDTNIIIYSVKRPMRTIQVLNAHKDSVNTVEWSGRNTLVSSGADACIRTWDLEA